MQVTVFVSFTTAPEVIEWQMNVVDRKVSEARKIRLPIVDAVWVLFYLGFPNVRRVRDPLGEPRCLP